MASLRISIQRDARGLFGYRIEDGRGTALTSVAGITSLEQAEDLGTLAAVKIVASDRRHWIESGLCLSVLVRAVERGMAALSAAGGGPALQAGRSQVAGGRNAQQKKKGKR